VEEKSFVFKKIKTRQPQELDLILCCNLLLLVDLS